MASCHENKRVLPCGGEDSCLSEDQEQIIQRVKNGRNVFITGSAGVGKSFLLQEIIKSSPHKKTYITASTGVAACNIGGSTLHSFAGIGLGDKEAEYYGRMIKTKRYKIDVKERWTGCELLIIDEISMVDGNLFNKVEQVARIVRTDERPFGGIQIVLCGDFLQLPPVKSQLFAFETNAWKKSIKCTVVLNKVFRQKHFGFISLLNRLRVGQITSIDVEVLHHCHQTLFPDDGIKPTCLYPLRASCDKVNTNELAKLPGKMQVFEAIDFSVDEFQRKQLETVCKYEKVLSLKVGAQVMLLYNKDIEGGLVNGARGVVIGFQNNIQRLQEDLRVLSQTGFDKDNEYLLHEQEKLIKKIQQMQDGSNSYPIVRFTNGIEIVITPQKITIEVLGRIMAYRSQVPLALAWAVSIHKSQGVTLDRVELNIANAFEHGQCYVALSRVTSLDGLLLRGLDPSKITAHPKVLLYYNNVDPSFASCTKGMGDEELKIFIGERKNYAKYKHRIDELTKKAKETERAVQSLLFEHNYSICDSPTSSDKHHFMNITLPSELHTTNNDNSCDSNIHPPAIIIGHTGGSTIQRIFPPLSTPFSTETLSFTNSSRTNSISGVEPDKASQLLPTCKSSQLDINSSASVTAAETISTPRKRNMDLNVSIQKNKHFNSNCENMKSNESITTRDLQLGNAHCSRNDVISGNDAIDGSFFGDVDDDNAFADVIAEITPVPKVRMEVIPRAGNHFFDNICSDLLKCAEKDQANNKRARDLPRGQKRFRKSEEVDQFVNSPSKRPHECRQDDNEARIKKLLKEKEASIEEKRRKALSKRLNSLRRRSDIGF